MVRGRETRKGTWAASIATALFLSILVIQGTIVSSGLAGVQKTGAGWRVSDDLWKISGDESSSQYFNMLALLDPALLEKELRGVTGASVDKAWGITTGRPDVVIAQLDTGMRWHDAGAMNVLARQCHLNEGELPPPKGASLWDKNGDGRFNIDDYLGDPTLPDANGNGVLDPQDLIWTFSDGEDDDNNGYVDDVCGWDFLEDDNDPWDEVDDGHGTTGAMWSVAGMDRQAGTSGTSPGAMLMPVRVGDSSVIDVNDFAQGVAFAVDSGARVVQGALTSWNNTSLGQEAIDYAWSKGVAVITSSGEEQSAHANFPSTYNHTVQVNALTGCGEEDPRSGPLPPSYLYLGGLSNYGAHSIVSCPSGGSSSEATARTAGIAALVYSAAEDRVSRGEMWRYPGTNAPLSACELKQLLAMSADDIDFSSVRSEVSFGPLDVLLGPSQRFPSSEGWDPYFGYGRVNACAAVEAVRDGHIPPEAEIRSPGWFELVNPGRTTINVVGRAAAARADSFQYTVEFGAGWNPGGDDWITVQDSAPQFEPVEGVLATLDLGEVYSVIQETMQARGGVEDPNRHAVSVRIRVRDNRGNWGEDRITFFCFDEPDAYLGTPFSVGSDISASPRFADLDDDGSNELIVASGDGYVHVYNQDFSEVPGWPVHLTPLALHGAAAGFSSGALAKEAYGSVSGTPAIGDLDHDGSLEVVAGDSEGRLYAWDKEGQLMPGFPARSNPLYSIPDRADWLNPGALPFDWYAGRMVPDRVHRLDRWNCLDKSFSGGPVLCNLDNSMDGSLEIVASCMDQHLYAWHMDGTPLQGWPVKLVDARKVAQFNPLTHTCVFRDPESVPGGRGKITAPCVADLDGDLYLEVVCGSSEMYAENGCVSSDSSAMVSSTEALASLLGDGIDACRGRYYAVYHDGTAHGLTPGVSFPPEQVPAHAYLPGWPAGIATLAPGVLPGITQGMGGKAAIADVDGDRTIEIGISSSAGPGFLLEPNSADHLGCGADGLPLSLECDETGSASESKDAPVICAPGGGCFATLGGNGLSYIAPTMGLGRVMDTFFPASQARSEDQVSAWSSGDGRFLSAFPLRMNGMTAWAAPGAADIDGDGSQEVLAGSSYYDLRCVGAAGKEAQGWPKFTGGWSVTTPAVGDLNGDGNREVAAGTREGWLLIWETASRIADSADWPEYGHDPWGTGCLDIDARRPGKVVDLAAETIVDEEGKVSVRLLWSAPGDDGGAGQALCYDIRCLDRPIDAYSWEDAVSLEGKPLPATAGSLQEWIIQGLPYDVPGGGATVYFALRSRDEAGNLSAISNLAILP